MSGLFSVERARENKTLWKDIISLSVYIMYPITTDVLCIYLQRLRLCIQNVIITLNMDFQSLCIITAECYNNIFNVYITRYHIFMAF